MNLAKLAAHRLREMLKRPFYLLYERRLASASKSYKKPKHIGIILDGNRRFARESGLASVIDGHARGADKLHEVLDWCYEFGIPVVTIWIFSVDNFTREASEVDGLLKLINEKSREMLHSEDIHRNRVQIRYMGRIDLLPDFLQETIREVEEATKAYDNHFLNVAIAYGGREEITDAVRLYMEAETKAGKALPDILKDLQPESLDDYLYTAGLPDPDLILRTSGEVRLSGFLLWQSAYSEFYFCDTYWPNFRYVDFLRAMRAFHVRQRRFGK